MSLSKGFLMIPVFLADGQARILCLVSHFTKRLLALKAGYLAAERAAKLILNTKITESNFEQGISNIEARNHLLNAGAATAPAQRIKRVSLCPE